MAPKMRRGSGPRKIKSTNGLNLIQRRRINTFMEMSEVDKINILNGSHSEATLYSETLALGKQTVFKDYAQYVNLSMLGRTAELINSLTVWRALLDAGSVSPYLAELKFNSTKSLPLTKLLYDFNEASPSLKLEHIAKKLDPSLESNKSLLSYILSLLKKKLYGSENLNGITNFKHLLIWTLGNYDDLDYRPFIKFTLSLPELNFDKDMEHSIFTTFAADPIIQMVNHPNYTPQGELSDIFDTLHFHEGFLNLNKQEWSNLKNALWARKEFSGYFVKNNYVEMYPEEVTDLFLF